MPERKENAKYTPPPSGTRIAVRQKRRSSKNQAVFDQNRTPPFFNDFLFSLLELDHYAHACAPTVHIKLTDLLTMLFELSLIS